MKAPDITIHDPRLFHNQRFASLVKDWRVLTRATATLPDGTLVEATEITMPGEDPKSRAVIAVLKNAIHRRFLLYHGIPIEKLLPEGATLAC